MLPYALKCFLGDSTCAVLASQDAEEVCDDILYSARVTTLLGQVPHGLHCLLHQLGIIGLQLT